MLLRFFMRRMLPASKTELLELQALRGGLTVLGGRIIPLFAVSALQVDDFSGHRSLPIPDLLCGADSCPRPLIFLLQYFRNRSCAHRVSTFADGEAQTLFHRDWRDEFNH